MLAAVAALAASLLLRGQSAQTPRERTGLFTSLPILWAESADLSDLLKPQQTEHWARPLLAAGGELVPLDALAAADGTSRLVGLRYLVLAQPRPLSPQENVALDAWVRAGGKLLLLADPLLTGETIYPLGDPRRPQDVVMLDPLLKHWGLRLDPAEGGSGEEATAQVMGMAVPFHLPGRLTVADPQACKAWDDGLAASCKLGKGRVLVLADAAVLELDDAAGTKAKALRLLLEAAFVEE